MMNKFVKRTLVGLLALTLLIPSVASAVPAAKAAPKAGASKALTLYSWDASYGVDYALEVVKDNVIKNPAQRSDTHYVLSMAIHDNEGIRESDLYYFIRSYAVKPATSAVNYGLPREIVGPGANEYKATESLELQFNDMKPIRTKGAEAVNLRMTFVASYNTGSFPVHEMDKFEVRVSLDGETWLEETVGLRSWNLEGYGSDVYNRGMFFYTLETENFFNIDGLEPGDTIQDIMIRPHGDGYWGTSWFIMGDVAINAYETEEDWETEVPDGRSDTLKIGEEKMREIVLDRLASISDIEWVSEVPIVTDAVSGTDYKGEGGTILKEFVPGIPYRGPMYTRAHDTSFELLKEHIVDGVYVGGRTTGVCGGMDCSSYAYDAYTLVSRSFSYLLFQTQSDNSLVMLGNIKTKPCPVFTNLDIVNINDAQTIYEGYALLKGGDVMTTYTTTGAIHHRMVREDAVVVRNADGTIDPKKSYIPSAEQTDYMWYLFEAPDGTQFWEPLNDPQALQGYRENYPHYKLVCGSNSPKLDFTFEELRNGYYVPFTLKEYISGEVENVQVQTVMHAVDYKDMTSGFVATISADYNVIEYDVRLEDLDRGTVLYEERKFSRNTQHYALFYNNPKFDARLAELTDGNYRISLCIQAGPVTQVGADRPITIHTRDFTVDKKASAAQVELKPSASAVAKGETVTVEITSTAPAEAADVKVKFDSEQLTYVNGTAEAALSSVTCNGNIAHVLSGDATSGTKVATLTFTAKQDIANVAGIMDVLSASVVTDVGGHAVKASGSNDCPSAFYADVNPNAWYRDAVDYALTNGIMGGYNSTTFGTNDKLSRAMVVQVLYNKEGQSIVTGSHKFPDVKNGDWFSNAVTWANLNGVVGGYGDGRFGPNDNVTIEQVAVILWNYSGNPKPTGDASTVGAHSDWAANALSWAVANGIFKDMPYETVTGTATRAQTAQMLMNYLKK